MESLLLVHADAAPDNSVANTLRARGFDLTSPSGSEAAFEAVVEGHPRALVYILPPAPAQDLAILRLVRRAAPELPLILLATESSLQVQRESLQLRPVYFAVFPIDEEELLGAVEAALKGPRRRARSAKN
jgi:DNA-binding NtrC family response regulator